MDDELDRLIKELGILRINIASMAVCVESIQSALEHLRSQAEAVRPEPEPVSEVVDEPEPEMSVAEPQPVDEGPAEPVAYSAPVECGMAAGDAEVIAESVEMEEEADADEPQPVIAGNADDAEDDAGGDMPVPGRELRQFFTINDRYRFRRELFGNSDTDMADTLNMIEAMASVAEVQDYVYSDLGWDPEIEEVQEFMDIVTRYFNER